MKGYPFLETFLSKSSNKTALNTVKYVAPRVA